MNNKATQITITIIVLVVLVLISVWAYTNTKWKVWRSSCSQYNFDHQAEVDCKGRFLEFFFPQSGV